MNGRAVPFVKASACGNDFLIVEGMDAPADLAAFSRAACERHSGVGADGVEFLYATSDADVEARLLNADGSEAEISGNGTRCVAAYLCAKEPKERFTIRTGAGVKTCSLISRKEQEYEFESAMGEPQVEEELTIRLGSGEVRGIPASMGNPHYVVLVNDFARDWQAQGFEIGQQAAFPHGTNVEFVKVQDRSNLEVRFFERGVGETQSSGTGSCASAVAAVVLKRADSPVRVHAAGGTQTVRWEKEVFLRGTARLICRGEIFIEG